MIFRLSIYILFVKIVLSEPRTDEKRRKIVKITIFNIRFQKDINENIDYIKLITSSNPMMKNGTNDGFKLRKKYFQDNKNYYFGICKILDVTSSDYFSISVKSSTKGPWNVIEGIRPYYLNIDGRHTILNIYLKYNLDVRIIILDTDSTPRIALFSEKLTLSIKEQQSRITPEIIFRRSNGNNLNKNTITNLARTINRAKYLNTFTKSHLLQSISNIKGLLTVNNINGNFMFGNEDTLIVNLMKTATNNKIKTEIFLYRGFKKDRLYWEITYYSDSMHYLENSRCFFYYKSTRCNKKGESSCKNPTTYNTPYCNRTKFLCHDNPCLNNGQCIEEVDIKIPNKKYYCKCFGEHRGKHCETRVERSKNDSHGLKYNVSSANSFQTQWSRHKKICKNGDILLENNNIFCKCNSYSYTGNQCELKCTRFCSFDFCYKERNKIICSCPPGNYDFKCIFHEYYYLFAILILILFVLLFITIAKIIKSNSNCKPNKNLIRKCTQDGDKNQMGLIIKNNGECIPHELGKIPKNKFIYQNHSNKLHENYYQSITLNEQNDYQKIEYLESTYSTPSKDNFVYSHDTSINLYSSGQYEFYRDCSDYSDNFSHKTSSKNSKNISNIIKTNSVNKVNENIYDVVEKKSISENKENQYDCSEFGDSSLENNYTYILDNNSKKIEPEIYYQSGVNGDDQQSKFETYEIFTDNHKYSN